MRIESIQPERLHEYASIPMTCAVRSILQVEPDDQGLGGLRLREVEIARPYVKDYDALETPTDWAKRFDVEHWGFWIALEKDQPIGAMAVAWNTSGVHMLEGRCDLAVLWDLRVHPNHRRAGVGRALFETATRWAREHGCHELKIETQNVNVAACRFYRSMGCELSAIDTRGYAKQAGIDHEAMLIWRLDLYR